jgi:single-strand DNA-binding protein
MNEATIIGNLGGDPDTKTFPDGNTLVRLNVATNRNYKNRDGEWVTDTEWHTISVRGAAAERAAQLAKGNRVMVRGSIQTRKYQKQDGSQGYATEIVVAGPGSFVADQTPRKQALATEAARPESDPDAPAQAAPPRAPATERPPFEDDIPF